MNRVADDKVWFVVLAVAAFALLFAAVEYGRLAAELRRRGRSMQQIDIQIAAVALTLGECTVVSKDRDLRDVPGLKVEDWSQP